LSDAGSRDLAIFPLNAVLFPGGLLPLRIFEQRYMEMAKACLKDDEPFGICLIRSGREVGAPATPEPVGCTARIVEWDMQQLGVLSVKARGEQRFRILESRVTETALTRARVEMLPQDVDSELPEEFGACATLLKAVFEEHGSAIVAAPLRFESSSWVGSRLAEILPVPLAAKQKLLELDDARQRIEILGKFLQQHRLDR
jgi:Lon protease-like protein